MDASSVLITGAGGFLGSRIAEILRVSGQHVLPFAGRLPSEEFAGLLRKSRPRLLVHCAGTSRVERSFEQTAADFHDNVVVTESVLAALAAASPGTRFVFLSSAAVYGEPLALPITEQTPPRPISPYGHHKLLCEGICRKYHELSGVSVAVLRIFSAYGPGLAKQVLWDIHQKSRQRTSQSRGIVRLDGTGQERRDFVYADDVARLVLRLVRNDLPNWLLVNVASGRSISIRELAEMFLAKLGRTGHVIFSGRSRRGAPRTWEADVAQLGSLGLDSLTPLECGLDHYAAWLREIEGGADANRILAVAG
jgi:nucleoside-diphosphate-sugar epimerase